MCAHSLTAGRSAVRPYSLGSTRFSSHPRFPTRYERLLAHGSGNVRQMNVMLASGVSPTHTSAGMFCLRAEWTCACRNAKHVAPVVYCMRHRKLGFIRCVLRAALPGMLALIERSRVSAAAIEADVRSYNMVLSRQLVENDLAAAAETCEIMQARRHRHSSVVSRWPSSPSVSSTLSAPCSAAARFFCRMLDAAEGLAAACGRAGSA